MRKLIFLFFFLPFLAHAQDFKSNIQDTVLSARLFSVNVGGQLPGADMQQRFGTSMVIGTNFMLKTKKNWVFGIEGNYIFGSNVKEDTGIAKLADDSGRYVGTNGHFAALDLSERGYMISGKVGKLVPAFGSNANSGLLFLVGAGFIQHKIRIVDVSTQLPQLRGDYAKGYDRLSNGLMLNQFVGYMHLDKSKWVNFYAGIEVTEGFTKNRRDWNFDQMRQDDSRRLDLLFGAKVGWMLPFYGKTLQEFYTF